MEKGAIVSALGLNAAVRRQKADISGKNKELQRQMDYTQYRKKEELP